MKPMNVVIKNRMSEMKKFLDDACTISDAECTVSTSPARAFGADVDVAREASAVYSHANV